MGWSHLARAFAMIALVLTCRPSFAADPPPEDLTRGRALFTHALELETQQKFAEALDALERVREIRDTPQVRYRIGTCLAGLMRYRDAVVAFERAASLSEATDAALAAASRDKVRELVLRIPELTLRPGPSEKASELVVLVDGAAVRNDLLGTAMPLDPGAHVIRVDAPDRGPAMYEISLKDGDRKSLVIVTAEPPSPSRIPEMPARKRPTWPAWVALGGSAAFVAGGVTALIVRANAISELHEACPGDRCPSSRRGELASTQDRAITMAPVAVALFAMGGAAAAFGVYWIVSEPSVQVAAGPTGVSLGGTF